MPSSGKSHDQAGRPAGMESMKKTHLILAFDHELSLGSARSHKQNFFDPTDSIIDLAIELDVPICLFTNVCSAQKFREWDRSGFCKPFCDQLRRATETGHDVQLHIHPQWLTSEFRNGTFVPASTYSLGSFKDRTPPNSIDRIVTGGIDSSMRFAAK